MAGAMLMRWLATGLDPARVTVIRPSGKRVAPGVRVLTGFPADEPPPAMLMLGIKPQKLSEIAGLPIGAQTILISVLAGVTTAGLRAAFPTAGAIVRVVPNMPVALGKGVVALHAEADAQSAESAAVADLMAPLGLVEWLADEALCDAMTALAGCGPAFLFRFVDALGNAAALLGIPADQAARLALATVTGAAALAEIGDAPPAVLADRVASPGGSTRAGLNVLDAPDGIAGLLARTLAASEKRNAELAKSSPLPQVGGVGGGDVVSGAMHPDMPSPDPSRKREGSS